jgi:hypothetical protein
MMNLKNAKLIGDLSRITIFIVIFFYLLCSGFYTHEHVSAKNNNYLLTITPSPIIPTTLSSLSLTNEQIIINDEIVSTQGYKNKSIDFGTIGSIVAIIIGLLALAVSIWQGFETRNNYRLSVTPKICMYADWTTDSENFGINIGNKGIGPAIITNISILFENQMMECPQNSKKFISILDKKAIDAGVSGYYFNDFDIGDAISVGENQPYLWLSTEAKADYENRIKFRTILAGLKIFIDYKSIYNDNFYTGFEFTD